MKQQNISQTLQVPLTLKEKDCKPYWDMLCKDIQSDLWLPHKIELRDQVTNLLSISLNYQEEKSQHLIRRIVPQNLIQNNSSHLSLHSAIVTTEKDQPRLEKYLESHDVITAKQVRIYPQTAEAKQLLNDLINLGRKAYNLAVEYFRESSETKIYITDVELRQRIKARLLPLAKEFKTAYHSDVVANAVLQAKQTFLAVCKKNKNKAKNEPCSNIQFKRRDERMQTIFFDRFPRTGKVLKSILKDNIHYAEKLNLDTLNSSIGKTYSITKDANRWYLNIKTLTTIKPVKNETSFNKIIALDPGVRTFLTGYSTEECIMVGESFAKDNLAPLAVEVSKLISLRDKLDSKSTKKWEQERLTHYNNRINKLKRRKEDLVEDLHNRICYYLVSNYDVIFLPTYEASQMVRKTKTKDLKVIKRRINRATVANMLSLSFYKFSKRLEWYCLKYGKTLVRCNEAYTSKTNSWTGEIDEKLGSKKTIKHENISVDRDVNGARGIFIKCINQTLKIYGDLHPDQNNNISKYVNIVAV